MSGLREAPIANSLHFTEALRLLSTQLRYRPEAGYTLYSIPRFQTGLVVVLLVLYDFLLTTSTQCSVGIAPF